MYRWKAVVASGAALALFMTLVGHSLAGDTTYGIVDDRRRAPRPWSRNCRERSPARRTTFRAPWALLLSGLPDRRRPAPTCGQCGVRPGRPGSGQCWGRCARGSIGPPERSGRPGRRRGAGGRARWRAWGRPGRTAAARVARRGRRHAALCRGRRAHRRPTHCCGPAWHGPARAWFRPRCSRQLWSPPGLVGPTSTPFGVLTPTPLATLTPGLPSRVRPSVAPARPSSAPPRPSLVPARRSSRRALQSPAPPRQGWARDTGRDHPGPTVFPPSGGPQGLVPAISPPGAYVGPTGGGGSAGAAPGAGGAIMMPTRSRPGRRLAARRQQPAAQQSPLLRAWLDAARQRD